MSGLRIYLAGPLFTVPEREWNKILAHRLREDGHEVFVPQENEPRERTAGVIFWGGGLLWANCVVANLDGPVADDGTAWEVGWAFAKGYPILGYRTDVRSGEGDLAPVNLMLHEACDIFLRFGSRASREEALSEIMKSAALLRRQTHG